MQLKNNQDLIINLYNHQILHHEKQINFQLRNLKIFNIHQLFIIFLKSQKLVISLNFFQRIL